MFCDCISVFRKRRFVTTNFFENIRSFKKSKKVGYVVFHRKRETTLLFFSKSVVWCEGLLLVVPFLAPARVLGRCVDDRTPIRMRAVVVLVPPQLLLTREGPDRRVAAGVPRPLVCGHDCLLFATTRLSVAFYFFKNKTKSD